MADNWKSNTLFFSIRTWGWKCPKFKNMLLIKEHTEVRLRKGEIFVFWKLHKMLLLPRAFAQFLSLPNFRVVVSGSDSPIHTNTLERHESYLVCAYGHAQIVSGFENIQFRSSTRIRELSGLKKIHSGERFQKGAVSVSEFTGFVWTEGRFA